MIRPIAVPCLNSLNKNFSIFLFVTFVNTQKYANSCNILSIKAIAKFRQQISLDTPTD